MARRSIKLVVAALALGFLAAGALFEMSDDQAANAMMAGASEPFLRQ